MSRFDTDRFEVPPDEELICCICQGVLDKPLETPCRHVFCKVCIETWLKNCENQNCPSCRADVSAERLCTALPLLNNLLNKLRIYCLNRTNGCQLTWLIESYDDEHEKTCEFRTMSCRYPDCRSQIMVKNLAKHEEKCDYRPIVCTRQCGLTIIAKNKARHACVPLLKETMEGLKKKLQEAEQEVARLRACNDDLKRQLSEQTSNPGSDLASNADDGDDMNEIWARAEPSDDDQNSNSSSLNDFLFSDQNSDASSAIISPNVSERSQRRGAESSLTDSMVGFSESSDNEDYIEQENDGQQITISSDSSSGYHTMRRTLLSSPFSSSSVEGTQQPDFNSPDTEYYSAPSPPDPRSPSETESWAQEPDQEAVSDHASNHSDAPSSPRAESTHSQQYASSPHSSNASTFRSNMSPSGASPDDRDDDIDDQSRQDRKRRRRGSNDSDSSDSSSSGDDDDSPPVKRSRAQVQEMDSYYYYSDGGSSTYRDYRPSPSSPFELILEQPESDRDRSSSDDSVDSDT